MFRAALLLALSLVTPIVAEPLPGTEPLTEKGDLAAKMVRGIDAYLMRELAKAPAPAKAPGVARLRELLGIVEWPAGAAGDKTPVELASQVKIAETETHDIYAIRWNVLSKVDGEGLLLEPKGRALAQVVALPDADDTPEDVAGLNPKVPAARQFARMLAERKVRVIVPSLINRKSQFSGNPEIDRKTTQPHREFLYRMAYEMGRHLIGYEVQRVIAAGDYLRRAEALPVGIIGRGEGGVIALYAAAVDPTFKSIASIGYAGPLPTMWKEPIYRNVWAILNEFGTAGFWRLLIPRAVCIGYNDDLKITGPAHNSNPGMGPTPGDIVPLPLKDYESVVKVLQAGENRSALNLKGIDHGNLQAGMTETIRYLLAGLGVPDQPGVADAPAAKVVRKLPNDETRQQRLYTQIADHVQHLWRASEPGRLERFNKLDYKSPEAYARSIEPVRKYFHEEVIGKLPAPSVAAQPKSREIYDTPAWKGHEVTLELYPDVFAYGILLMPKDIKPGEKRPVVVCQHGLEGRPTDVCDPTKKTTYYNSFGAQLANRGYIVFAPQNPYIFHDDFRVLQRKGNPLKLSLFSFIVRQHERILEWLPMLPQVDGNNLGFYGLSYGGKTAMRVPAILPNYKYSICSGDFNEWVGKNVSLLYRNSYMFTGEYEMYEFNLGRTFNYAEIAYLIAPRPFMVERGHDDGVGSDEMVSYEFAKVRYHYAKRLGIGSRTEIEYFVGGHEIKGVGTFDFIQRHSGWPATRR